MQYFKGTTILIIFTAMIFTACEEADTEEDILLETDIYTQDINAAPQFFTFESESFSDTTYDLTFSLGSMVYLVGLNSTAGVLAFGSDTVDFTVEDVPAVGYRADGNSMVIGSSWMDIGTYNPTDHSISSNQMIYFIRTADYNWVKMRVVSATPSLFNIEYCIYTEDSGYGIVQSASVPFASDAPAHFTLSRGQTAAPNSWDMAIATTPEFSTELQTNFYMPTLLFNHQKGIEVAIIDNLDYDDMMHEPAGMSWMMDSSSNHSFGNGGVNQVLVYHPEPPYNHKVLVENPALVYLVKTSTQTYKLQFKDYSSGIVVFAYDAL
jgi:hypothetical protein